MNTFVYGMYSSKKVVQEKIENIDKIKRCPFIFKLKGEDTWGEIVGVKPEYSDCIVDIIGWKIIESVYYLTDPINFIGYKKVQTKISDPHGIVRETYFASQPVMGVSPGLTENIRKMFPGVALYDIWKEDPIRMSQNSFKYSTTSSYRTLQMFLLNYFYVDLLSEYSSWEDLPVKPII